MLHLPVPTAAQNMAWLVGMHAALVRHAGKRAVTRLGQPNEPAKSLEPLPLASPDADESKEVRVGTVGACVACVSACPRVCCARAIIYAAGYEPPIVSAAPPPAHPRLHLRRPHRHWTRRGPCRQPCATLSPGSARLD